MSARRYTQEHLAFMDAARKAGDSASVIADKLLKQFGIKASRNAIVGVFHRMTDPHVKPKAAKKAAKPSTKAKPKRPDVKRVHQAPRRVPGASITVVKSTSRMAGIRWRGAGLSPGARAVIDHAGGCRWPIGDLHDPTFRFCCAPKPNLASYCLHHAAIAYAAGTGARDIESSADDRGKAAGGASS